MQPDSEPGFPEAFRCDVEQGRDIARIRAVGELDLATVPVLEAQIDALRTAGIRHFIVDLSALDFMDSTGLRCILDCNAQSRQDGFSVSFVRGPPAVHRVFELTGTSAHLPFVDP